MDGVAVCWGDTVYSDLCVGWWGDMACWGGEVAEVEVEILEMEVLGTSLDGGGNGVGGGRYVLEVGL